MGYSNILLRSTLAIKADDIEYVHDTFDTNAINFRASEGYFSIQTGVYLEEDERLNEPFFELNSQEQSQSGGLARVLFDDAVVTLDFQTSRPFLGKFAAVEIEVPTGVNRQLVDFFNNHLFLASYAEYDESFDKTKIVPGTASRDLL